MGWMALALALVGADEPKAEEKAEAPKAVIRVNPNYSPRPGDRAILYSRDEKGEPFDIWAAADAATFREYAKAVEMDDEKRMEQFEDANKQILEAYFHHDLEKENEEETEEAEEGYEEETCAS